MSDWNEQLVAVVQMEKANALAQSRAAAIMHTAIFEAVNSIERRYRPYSQAIAAPAGASAESAAASAAHLALTTLYPHQRGRLDEALTRSLAAIPAAPARQDGVVVGERAAEMLLALRRDDGADAQVTYKASFGAGAWVPAAGAPALAPHWGSVEPWGMDRGSQFRPGPPPRMDSDAFRRDYLEVKQMGGKTSATRTAEQTQLANFWTPSGVVLWSPITAQLAKAGGLNLAASSRLFALHAMAGADALVACWDAKYAYQNFRPVTAIRTGAGRDDLPADEAWEPAIPTPPFPAYVSGHACYAGATQAVLEAQFGDGEVPALTMTSPAVPGLRRQHKRIRDIVAECANARVWGGIHWRTDQVEGEELGRKVARHMLQQRLLPVP
ncbi:vanadium-dependent haloperoxidase [Ideonella sp. YS5]|uniref:vanadium-dependent haloperoxidase n=1 Tax=Ideonella sp. YS5 TaxID=3453714 RepID=UPI003EF06616